MGNTNAYVSICLLTSFSYQQSPFLNKKALIGVT